MGQPNGDMSAPDTYGFKSRGEAYTFFSDARNGLRAVEEYLKWHAGQFLGQAEGSGAASSETPTTQFVNPAVQRVLLQMHNLAVVEGMINDAQRRTGNGDRTSHPTVLPDAGSQTES